MRRDQVQTAQRGELSLAHGIADRLRKDILLENLRPGAPVKERDHAAELGVSRTPLREAIRILAQEGLLILRPSRSPIVANPGLREVTDDMTVLRTLEVLSCELACEHATEVDLAELRATHENLADSYDKVAPVDLFEIDMEFHKGIARASQNKSLADTHAAYLARLWRVRFLSARQRRNRSLVVGQHAEILRAIEARDTASARAAVQEHLYLLADNIALQYKSTHSDSPDFVESPRPKEG